MEVGIVAQRGNPTAVGLAEAIEAAVDAAVVLDATTAAAIGDAAGVPVDAMADCDLVVSIGGDGTFLFAARGAGGTPVMGVNLGEVGFLNVTAPEDAVETVLGVVERAREGRMDVDELPRVTAEADGWTLPPAINEVALMGLQRGRGHGVDVEVRVGGARYTEAHADGVIVATPTGSTAYNLSERGPLVHPAVAGLVVTVMCGADAMPPLVVPPDREVTVALSGAQRAVAASDGRAVEEVTTPGEVRVRRTDPPVRIAGPDLDFFSALGKLS